MDELGSGVQSEKLDIFIEDQLAARIELDAPKKRQFVALNVSGKVEPYRLAGLAVGTANGKKLDYTGEGSGTIDLTKPAVFAVHAEGSGKDNMAQLSLIKESP